MKTCFLFVVLAVAMLGICWADRPGSEEFVREVVSIFFFNNNNSSSIVYKKLISIFLFNLKNKKILRNICDAIREKGPTIQKIDFRIRSDLTKF